MDDLSSLEGRLRHCVRRVRGKNGKMRCASYKPGPGRLVGKNLKNFKRSTTKKRPAKVRVCRKIKGQKKRTCYWRYLTAAQARRTRKRVSRKATVGKGVYRASRKSRKTVSKRRVKSANQLYRQGQAAIARGQKMIARANKKAGAGGPMGGLEGVRRHRRSAKRRRTRR